MNETVKEQFEEIFLHPNQYNQKSYNQEELEILIDTALLTQPEVLLDYGCGTGIFSLAIKEKSPNLRVLGYDLTENGIAFARKQTEKKQLDQIVFESFDGKYLPIKDNAVDIAVMRFVFHHLDEPDEVIREIRRVLKPGGIFLLADPGRMDEGDEFLNRYFDCKSSGYVHFYTAEQLEKQFNAAGFELIGIKELFLPTTKKDIKKYGSLFESADQETVKRHRIKKTEDSYSLVEPMLHMVFQKKEA